MTGGGHRRDGALPNVHGHPAPSVSLPSIFKPKETPMTDTDNAGF